MPRPLRFIPEHSLVEITTRTLQGRLLLKPSPELNDLILGVIGKAQHDYDMVLQGFVVASNHVHLLARPSTARRFASFMQFLNARIRKSSHGDGGLANNQGHHRSPLDQGVPES
jgi:hypothetical protein